MTVDLRIAVPAAAGWLAAGILVGIPHAALATAIVLWAVAVLAIAVRWPGILALSLVVAAMLCSLVAAAAPGRSELPQGQLTGATLVVMSAGEGSIDGVPVRVFGELDAPIGATVLVSGSLSANEPGERTAYVLFSSRAEVSAPAPWYLDWANALRARFMDAASTLPGDGADLLPGLAIGDTRAVGDELDAAMKASSLSHTHLQRVDFD